LSVGEGMHLAEACCSEQRVSYGGSTGLLKATSVNITIAIFKVIAPEPDLAHEILRSSGCESASACLVHLKECEGRCEERSGSHVPQVR